LGRHADRFLQCRFFRVFGDVSRDGDSLGIGRLGAALFAGLVSRLSRREAATHALGRRRSRVARAVRQAFAAAYRRGARGASSAGPGASLGVSHERRPGSRDAAVARVPAHACVCGARLQRRHCREEAASRATAAGVAAALLETIRVRLRGRFAGGFADGEERRSSSDRCAGTVSNGKAVARGASRFFVGVDPGIAGGVEETMHLKLDARLPSGIWVRWSYWECRCNDGCGRDGFVVGPLDH
jgi:hypothetical protein